jgi:phosphoribosylglycinamide formyltransferase-1
MSGEDLIKEIAKNIRPVEKKLNIAVLTSGDGGNLSALIKRAQTGSFHIKLVISNNPQAKAREKAQIANIESYLIDHRKKSRDIFENEIVSHLNGIDLVVLAGFLRIFSFQFLKHFPKKVINLHPSLLPKHPGLDAINKALKSDNISGCTVHLVDEGLDTGPIIAQLSCPILPDDDTLALKTRIQALEHKLLPDVVESIARACLR